jgi:hypothetical protein
MHRTLTHLLSLLPLALALVAGAAQAQLPQRTTRPITADPTSPPLPTSGPGVPSTDPRLEGQPQVVQPGTILKDPALVNTREPSFLLPGEAPGAVQVTATGPRSVTLSWSAPAGASGYWIRQAVAGQSTYYNWGSLVTETTGTVYGLLPATAYSFKVSAVYPQEMQRREGVSEPANATTAAAPSPSGLAASVVGRGQVSLTWDRLVEADGYRLSRNDSTLKDIKPVSFTGGTNLATTFDDAVMPGTHRYQIQAIYVVAYGVDKGAQAVSTLAPTPAVSVTITPGTRVKYCQTQAGAAKCAGPGASPVTIAANIFVSAEGRKSP